MATTIDYDMPRRPSVDLDEDSLEQLKARRASGGASTLDVDEGDGADGFELPGAEPSDAGDGELTVAVVPMRMDEFRCSKCFLVHHRSQRVLTPTGAEVCRECA